jgi:glyoxylase-like metal-dependent hydrolase (beta-lactamase superfamily II)
MNRRDFLLTSSAAVSLSLLTRGSLLAQTAPAAPTVPASAAPPAPPPLVTKFEELRRGVGIFTGRGGTIGWLRNREALVVIDTQFAEPAKRFLAELPGRDGRTIDVVINTHHHPDHVGGNAVFRPVTKEIVAHEKVPQLLQEQARRRPEAGEPTLPDKVFAEKWKFDAGDEVVHARHFGAGHTAGDIVVYFEKANVVHMGDLMFNRLYPVMDKPGGTRARNWSAMLGAIAQSYPDDARYIFGHGNPKFGVAGTAADLQQMQRYLDAVIAHVDAAVKAGKSKAEIVTLQNLDGFPDYHAERNSRLPGNLGVVYDELTGA